MPVTFFFEDVPGQQKLDGKALSSVYVSDFLATTDGLTFTKAFMQIKDAKVRRDIVKVVGEIAS